MTDIAAALFELIDAVPEVAATGGFYWTVVPPDVERPYLRGQIVSDVAASDTLRGRAGGEVRVQIDCFGGGARGYAQARDVALALRTALERPHKVQGWSIMPLGVSGPIDLGEDVDGVGWVPRAMIDALFFVKFNEE